MRTIEPPKMAFSESNKNNLQMKYSGIFSYVIATRFSNIDNYLSIPHYIVIYYDYYTYNHCYLIARLQSNYKYI